MRRTKPKRRLLPPEFFAPFAACNVPLQRCPVPREEASHRIVIMRAGAFGDILMGTPVLAALRAAYPNAHLTWIVENTEVQAIDANPYVDELLGWDSAYWKKMLRRLQYPLWAMRVLQTHKALRKKRYDIFISFQPEEWSLLTRGTGAPLRIGVFDTFRRFYGAKATSRNTRLYTNAYAHPNLPDHRIDQYLLTLEALGLPPHPNAPMSMGYTVADRAAANQFLTENGLLGKERLVVLAPLTTWPTKCWPLERYVELGDTLVREYHCRLVVIGSGRESEAVERLASQMTPRPVTAAGTLSFREMAALLDQAALLVSGDTGPMHVASALGLPQVALFGPTAPQWYGPRSPRAISLLQPVPCGPCDQKFCPNVGETHELCMKLLTVQEVLAAAVSLLQAPVLLASPQGG